MTLGKQSIISQDHRQLDSALMELALTLLKAASVDEVVSTAPPAIATALGPSRTYRVELLPASEPAASDQLDDARVRRLAIDCEGEQLGTIIVGPAAQESGAMPALDARAVDVVLRLLGTAIAAQQGSAVQQARLLKEAAELKFDVVSMLSHEMRTPLASIKGYASALLMDDVEWERATLTEFIQAIEIEADHLSKLIADMLESAAIDAGELRLDLEPLRVPQIAGRVVDKIGIQTSAHRFMLVFAPDFPTIEADAQRTEQVLTNLIDNAVKYSPDGGLVVVRGKVQPGEVVISVIDQGIGIAPEDLNKLFERFFRASPNRRRRISGTGLGLPIAEAIVRAHGGRIWAESTVGSGTTLSFALPHPRPATGRE